MYSHKDNPHNPITIYGKQLLANCMATLYIQNIKLLDSYVLHIATMHCLVSYSLISEG